MNLIELINYHTSAKPEKRKDSRISLRLPTEYCLSGSSRVHIGHTLDICEGGLFINIPEELGVNQTLRVKFYYPSDFGPKSIEAVAEVVRVIAPEKSRKSHRCALKFIDLSPTNLKNLRKLLKNLY